MDAFSKYFLELFLQIWEDVKAWITGIINVFLVDVYNNFIRYYDILTSYSRSFGFLGWFLFILSSILIILFSYFVFIRLMYIVKRYIKFVKNEVDKDDLQEQLKELNAKVLEVINEKNSILAMKVSQLKGLPKEEQEPEPISGTEISNSRFTKLKAVDLQYDGKMWELSMPEEDKITLEQIVDDFVNFCSSKLDLYYTHKTIMILLASMATSKVLILEGISGTGKTSLPYAMGKFFKNKTPIISVQPSWRDRADLLGYFNEFTKKFKETDFLKALYETIYRNDINLLVLDEMNLARIEYYFAEFLSIMELPDKKDWTIDLVPDVYENDPNMIINGKLNVPQNLWFVGTANKDDSTFTITDKVYDRAMIIEFASKGEEFQGFDVSPMSMTYEYLNSLYLQAKIDNSISITLLNKLKKLDKYLIETFKLAFGNRILRQMETFIPVYIACGGTETEALDHLLAHKVLRKFEALNITFLKDELDALLIEIDKIFGKNVLSESLKKIKDLQKLV